MGIHLSFWWMVMLVGSVKESSSRDLISQLFCQVIAYGLGLFLLLRAKAPNAKIRDFISLRATNPWFFPLALMLGIAAWPLAAQLHGYIHELWPQDTNEYDFVTLFYEVSMSQRVLIALGVTAVGPLLEEVLFRGAIFGPMRKMYEPLQVVLLTALYFALAHILQPRGVLPIFLIGILLGYLRVASGSMLPSAMLHMSFNAVPFIDLFSRDTPPTSDSQLAQDLSVQTLALFAAVCALLIYLVYWLSKRSRRAQHARSEE
jgi:membrane protease YdiL (CAAX protease family)